VATIKSADTNGQYEIERTFTGMQRQFLGRNLTKRQDFRTHLVLGNPDRLLDCGG